MLATVYTTQENFENAALFQRFGLPSTLIRHESGALFQRLGLPSTLIRHENAALFPRLGLPSTLIRHENRALFLRLGLPSTLIRHVNEALFLRLGLPSTLICHENGNFLKRSSNQRNLKTSGFRFHMDRKHFENITFRNRCRYNNQVIFLTGFSPNTNPKSVIDKFLNSSDVVWTARKHDAAFSKWNLRFSIPPA